MFAVYNDGRLSTRGPVETLYNVKKIDRVNPTNNENSENPPEKFIIPNYDHITKEASDAYKKSSNLDTREIIYHVSQIMNKEVLFVREDTTIEETYSILHDQNIRQLPIVDKIGKIKGVITQKNILDLIVGDLDNTNHSMRKILNTLDLPEVITADPIADIRRVAKVMVDFNLNAMPIVNEDDLLVGIVTRTDILRTVASVPPMQLWA
mgnify:CR=1 FL=1